MTESGKTESKPLFKIKVNDIHFEVEEEKLLAIDVLKIAKEHNAMPGEPDAYLLQGDKALYKLDDWVNFEDDDEFITIPNKPTDVA